MAGLQSVVDLSQLLWPRRRKVASGGNAPRVLALVRPGQDGRLIEAVSSEAGWILTLSDLPPAGSAKPATKLAPIILFDRDLAPGNWRETVASLTRRSPRPYLILLSLSSDGNLWDELQRVGGSDILRTPLDRESTLQAVRRAWSLWQSQQRVRGQFSVAGEH
jgi:DNA-binding NarL/FixJ family response regulator